MLVNCFAVFNPKETFSLTLCWPR